MSYQPDEAVTLRALQVRAASRDNQYKSLMEMPRRSLESTADNFGVAHEGISSHDLACRIVDALYPEAQAPVQSGDPNTIQAQMATAADRQRYAYMTGGQPIEESGDTWPMDVPEGMAGVGYRRLDGTICPLDSEGSVMLSGWGPEKVRFLLVSLAPFFEVDHVKEFVFNLDRALRSGDLNQAQIAVDHFIGEQNWGDDLQNYLTYGRSAAQPSDEPIYDQAAQQTGGWMTDNQAKEYPTVGTGDQGDAPTGVISTGEISQYKPGPY